MTANGLDPLKEYTEAVAEALADSKGMALPECFAFTDDALSIIDAAFASGCSPAEAVAHLEAR